MSSRQVIVGVTGASGALYAGRLLRALLVQGHRVHLVLSKYGRYLLHEELDFSPDKETVLQFLVRLYGEGVLQGELPRVRFQRSLLYPCQRFRAYRRHGGCPLFRQDPLGYCPRRGQQLDRAGGRCDPERVPSARSSSA